MQRVLNGPQMQMTDHYTIEKMGVPAMVLMEKASEAVCQVIMEDFDKSASMLVVCGSGNNGADGMAIARILYLKGFQISIYLVGNPDHFTKESALQWQIASNYGVPVVSSPDFASYDFICDAIFGTGLSREVKGNYKDVIDRINVSGKPVYAVDIPSGVHAGTGQIMGTAVKAEKTVTFAFCKTGCLLYPGASFAGKLMLSDVGIYEIPEPYSPDIHLLEKEDLHSLKVRKPDGNKGSFGKMLIYAGSKDIYGALYMCARAAFMSGAGMVKVLTDKENLPLIKTAMPEVMAEGLDKDRYEEQFTRALSWADYCAAGPGIGTDEHAFAYLSCLMAVCNKPMVLDADALNILSGYKELLKDHEGDLILTPHMGEMSRLSGLPVKELKADACEAAASFAMEYKVHLVMKDARTIIAGPDGKIYIHAFGNAGMATAGSGDVLTGTILGLLGQTDNAFMAAYLGVLLHGLAGDQASLQKGEDSLMALDIADGIPEILKSVR